MAGLTIISGYGAFTALIVVIGLCYGGFLAIMAPLTADLFGARNLPVNYGLMFLTVAIAAYIGPYLAAVLKQAENGNYTHAFIIAAILNLAGICIFGIFIFFRKKKFSLAKNGLDIKESTAFLRKRTIL
jgi:OFA family oxalate/formate antiporter-like MFS transporter